MIKKTALFLLLTVFIFTAACSETPKATSVTETGINEISAADAETEPMPDIPSGTDFEGYKFTFIATSPEEWGWAHAYIDTDSIDGEILNDTIYERNREIESQLNITINTQLYQLEGITGTNVSKAAMKSIQAGDNSFDAALPHIRETAKMIAGKYLYDIKEIPYIDLEKPWWDINAANELSLKNKLYFMPTNIDLTGYDLTMGTMFNKNVAEAHNIEDLYKVVTDNKWTTDKLLEIGKITTYDMDGDGKVSGEGDLYGVTTYISHGILTGMLASFDIKLINKDENDLPVINYNNDKFYTAVLKLTAVMQDSGIVANMNASIFPSMYFYNMFSTDHALFALEILQTVREWRNMEGDFGVIPLPKLDESQERYCSFTTDNATVLIVPVTNTNLERTGIIIEVLDAASYKKLVPSYIEVALTGKVFRDEESRPMYNLILENRIYDIGIIYNFGGLNTAVSKALINNKDMSSALASQTEKVETAIVEFTAYLDD